METVKIIKQTRKILQQVREEEKSIGFVPTMGALHEGHLELIRKAAKVGDFVAASIFVNPIQFNNKEDLEKYPRTLEKDLKLLKQNGCDLVFVPEVSEMYPDNITAKYNFGRLERVMEGKHRPGHFNGVAVVVKKLFDIVGPDKAFFGQKDFQQLLIIRKLVEIENIAVEIVACPTVREKDGLAMSSRNMRLTPEEREQAPFLYQTLSKAASMTQASNPEELARWGRGQIEQHPAFKLEYFEVARARELDHVEKFERGKTYVICLAAHLGKVRLIDNVIINS